MNNTENPILGLSLHHIGLVVESIEDSLLHYVELFGRDKISEVFTLPSRHVKICLIQIAESSYLELVQPTGEDSVVFALLMKKASYYHLAYKVKDITSTIERLEKLNYKALSIFNSEAFGGKQCVFVYSPEAHLMELIEA
jgi:methylmalonyl-CoA/ethylmalonyl-CoA epimerase